MSQAIMSGHSTNKSTLLLVGQRSEKNEVNVQPETMTPCSEVATNDGKESTESIRNLSANVDKRNDSSINVKFGKEVQSQVSSQIVSIQQENHVNSLSIGVGTSMINNSGSTQPLSVKYPVVDNILAEEPASHRIESWNVKGLIYQSCSLL